MRIYYYCVIVLVCSCLVGCLSLQSPLTLAEEDMKSWQSYHFGGDGFQIDGWQKSPQVYGTIIHVYIEGDGFAWAFPGQPSGNPTPHHPLALKLALLDESANVVYLARPCQYTARQTAGCDNHRWWTSERYSRRVVDRYHQILTELKHGQPSVQYALFAYSGGAAIASILAAERTDIQSLRTVAGNLDSEYVNQIHRVDAMPASLNPVTFARNIHIPQIHFVGLKDHVVPKEVAQRFVSVQQGSCAVIKEVVDANHQQGWLEIWPKLLEMPLPAC